MSEKYTPTIGLEIHAELKTQTKMFCNSKNDSDEKRPNKNICPVCVGHPGTLPVINKEAVKHILKMGIAINGGLADFSEFDRKNYFYPDIPKGYQISQYKYPLVSGGELFGVEVTRIHLEEDTASSIHISSLPQNIADSTQNNAEPILRPSASSPRESATLVDFNRAGMPLMELVTEPVIKEAKQASSFARELQMLLQYLGASGANMDKGEMRVEANISVSKDSSLGTKVEVKNLNSFKSVEKAINFEIERHINLLEKGEKITQETRGWDEVKEKTFSQRIKEESHDYRYFPEPDLPKLSIGEIPEFNTEVLKKELPELPWQKRERYINLGLKSEDAEFFVRDISRYYDNLFNAVIKFSNDKEIMRLASNYIISDLSGLFKDSLEKNIIINQVDFIKLMQMIKDNKISSRGAKDILAIMVKTGEDPEVIAEEKNFFQKSDEGELIKVVRNIIENNKKVAEDFKGGKEASLQFLIGQGMKETKGSANPEVLKGLFIFELRG